MISLGPDTLFLASLKTSLLSRISLFKIYLAFNTSESQQDFEISNSFSQIIDKISFTNKAKGLHV
jgi:subtilase family serine protease